MDNGWLPPADLTTPPPRPPHDQEPRRPRHRDGHPATTHAHQRKPTPKSPEITHPESTRWIQVQ
ncbi:hypothetical protein KCH_28030 [Kitasatospora cheerisanensis KCTC 2395]|uniref:Uncharacterized protein n=1 Tax=Kitasatospora cheerisanensis KCTC 2395 TaxID=1348663 RepID=A0A066YWG1_9ACTN|nr:hypothetical protein KCH_28030 [Kitasatospora cheerisanensis KCTC 2395]